MNCNEIFLYSPKLLQNEIKNLQETNISQEDKNLIIKFGENCKLRQLTDIRTKKYLFHLKKTAVQMPNLKEIDKERLNKFLIWLEQQKYSEHTKEDYRVTLSVFYKWLEAEKLGITVDELKRQRKEPEIVFNLKHKSKKKLSKLPEQLLNEEEILKLITNANNPRDKAFISMLFESGARISEIGTLKIKNINFEEYGTSIKVNGKTGERRILLVTSTEYIKNWLNQHPTHTNPESPLWLGEQSKKELKYSMFRKILIQTAKKSEIKKPINPHQFRHSRATIMSQNLTEQQLKVYFGWTQSSDMAAKYVHLSGKQIDDAILDMYGLKTKNQEQIKILPKKCTCGQLNEPTILFCKQCGEPLTAEAVIMKRAEIKKEQELNEKENQLKIRVMEEKLEILYQMMKINKG
ncbi:MAG: tyrosine-type recombinase/integrase [Candidatus ainarchaeum sp.]|nr:tyrosine-type recombinase/integrase [Candidatus ainarchaeum sp.]